MVDRNNPPQFGQPVHLPTGFEDAASFTPDGVGAARSIYKLVRNVSGPQGTDEANINPDASVDESIFEYRSPADGNGDLLFRCNMFIVGDNPNNEKFGGVAGPLTNGVIFEVTDAVNAEVLDFEDTLTVKKNLDFILLAGVDMEIVNGSMGSDDSVRVRWTFLHAGSPLVLAAGSAFRVRVNDDISGNSEFRAMVQGVSIAD